MYQHGRGVTQNDAEAVRWYWLAAEQGDADAQNNLGALSALGKGVRRDVRGSVFLVQCGRIAGARRRRDQYAAAGRRDDAGRD